MAKITARDDANEIANANQAYGALTESLHIAGYTLERAFRSHLEPLIGGDAWRRCGPGFDDINAFMDSLRLDKFRLIADERRQIVARIKELQPKVTNRQIARTLGVHHDTVNRDAGGNPPPGGRNGQKNGRAAGGNPPPGLTGGQAARIVALRDERRETRAQRAVEAAADGVTSDPTGKYRIGYADCPWDYGAHAQPDYQTEQRDHYPVMTIEELCALPVKEWFEDNAVLFFWVTAPIIQRSFEVIEAWGFTYKAMFVWDKIKHNMGHYNSVRHELLLICTRGACQPDIQTLFDSVQSIERGRHSEKPVEFYDIIETLYTHGRRLTMFTRARRDGWDAYGHVAEMRKSRGP